MASVRSRRRDFSTAARVSSRQIADLERDSREFDVDQAALAMSPYVDAGLTTFDVADHYGSAEDIAGMFGERAERLTKWAPRPGPRI